MKSFELNQDVGDVSLQKACLFYGTSNNHLSLMTIHDVAIVKNQPVIKEGRIASTRSVKKMLSGFSKNKDLGLQFIQHQVLAKDNDRFVWFVPAGKRRLFFNKNAIGSINVNGEVDNPPLIFAKTNKAWYVFAFDSNERPTLETPLLFSPYLNIYDTHAICTGSTILPSNDDTAAWTTSFFSSAFTHSNYRSKASKLHRRGERTQLWNDLLNSKLKKFPIKALPSANLTLGQFLEKLNHHE